MKTLYESILDTDKETAERTGNVLFFPYFAECFVKVFGKVDRNIVNLDKRQGAPQMIGKIEVEKWKYTDRFKNQFRDKLQDMIDMLEKRYPKLDYIIKTSSSHLTQNIWKIGYTIHLKLQEYEFDWYIDIIEENNNIKKIRVFSLQTQANKNKELLKIIDDNI